MINTYHQTKVTKFLTTLIIVSALFSCSPIKKEELKKPILVDKTASKNVISLHKKLANIAKKGFAIGHQDATSYGIGWNYENDTTLIKSDVNEVVGDFPAVYGFDIGHLELAHEFNLDSVNFNSMRKLIIDAHKKGGIITISWHLDNPTSGSDSWDKTPAVKDIINGGIHKDKYELWVSRVADFLKTLRYNGEEIPIIFRPYHEMNGGWFWWGEGNCSTTDYKQLWQETVVLLRDKHNIHNLLYAYSPNKLNPNDDYLRCYPGDEFVDILGIDIYDFKNSDTYKNSVINDLNIVKNIATEKNKLFAFTETGLETIQTPKWFTEVVYPAIENSGISYILFWRNGRLDHHYMPYKGHVSEDDFKQFESLPKTLFLKDINSNLN
ncbi:glycoside hydrolase family 26 protein [Lutibacter flavus]|uniref:Mannan endo-1,4-beta-mannosidase n=1 Tax=Lutibacter flavus TaxID=691689 RepID=A0A238VC44_9FLAO|nr:glycosyl hydrolase [Lutibacter flavus]SNR31253.1 mannan endo-1,4-beta-mannosidase [Lutibacter flavus]